MVLIYLVKHLLSRTHKANVNDRDKSRAGHATPLWRRLPAMLGNALVSLVNPRLTIFPSAALLAILVGLLTTMGVALVSSLLLDQCTDTCGLVPVQYIDVTDNKVCDAISINDKLPGYDGVTAAGSLHSTMQLAKCSFLHSQVCGYSGCVGGQRADAFTMRDVGGGSLCPITHWGT